MQCNKLNRLVREWYTHVSNETMAPARMMQFIEQHVNECDLCREDPDLQQEIEKVREYVLPDSKLPKAFRAPNKALTPEISPTIKKKIDLNSEKDSEKDLEKDSEKDSDEDSDVDSDVDSEKDSEKDSAEGSDADSNSESGNIAPA